MANGFIFVIIVTMLLNLQHDFSANSRVWVYAADRLLAPGEAMWLKQDLLSFVSNWKAHQAPLRAHADVLYNSVVVIMVDENLNAASGCSIDKSVEMIKNAGKKLQVDFFNRMLIHAFVDNEISIFNLQSLRKALDTGIVTPETYIVNHLVQTKQDLETKFKIMIKNSWASKYLVQQV